MQLVTVVFSGHFTKFATSCLHNIFFGGNVHKNLSDERKINHTALYLIGNINAVNGCIL